MVGQESPVDAALALTLANDKRFDDAVAVWTSIGSTANDDQLSEARSALTNDLLSAKRFIQARRVSASANAEVGRINDGGFERNVKLQSAGPFDWQITDGAQPQIAQSTRQPHGGERSLVLVFSSNDGSGLRQISQTVPVGPGKRLW